MDPTAIAATVQILTGILNGASGEAGAKALDGLLGLFRRASHGSPSLVSDDDVVSVMRSDPEAAVRLLLGSADGDPEIKSALESWISSSRSLLDASNDSTVNIFAGSAEKVIQARDIGSINLS